MLIEPCQNVAHRVQCLFRLYRHDLLPRQQRMRGQLVLVHPAVRLYAEPGGRVGHGLPERRRRAVVHQLYPVDHLQRRRRQHRGPAVDPCAKHHRHRDIDLPDRIADGSQSDVPVGEYVGSNMIDFRCIRSPARIHAPDCRCWWEGCVARWLPVLANCFMFFPFVCDGHNLRRSDARIAANEAYVGR